MTLADKLQETADALRSLCRTAHPKSDHHEEAQDSTKPLGEYRSYHLPHYILSEEAEVLKYYRCKTIADAFNSIHTELHLTSLLLKDYSLDKDMDGFTLQLLGEHLSRPLNMLSKACSVLADFRLVQASPAP